MSLIVNDTESHFRSDGVIPNDPWNIENVIAPQALIKKIDKCDVHIYAEREKAWNSNEQGPNHKQTRLIEFMAQSDIN